MTDDNRTSPMLATTPLHDGDAIPTLGLAARGGETSPAALRAGIDEGITLLDVAADAEELVGEAIGRRRDELFLIAKVQPANASHGSMLAACTATLRRLGTDRVDLYLLQGRGPFPLLAGVQALEELRDAGLILHWGVAAFGLHDVADLFNVTRRCAAIELSCGLGRRGPKRELLDDARERGMPVLACSSPALRPHPRLLEVAERHQATPTQIHIAWLLGRERLAALVPVRTPAEAEELRAAADVRLDGHDLAMLDEAFAPAASSA